ncbi:hypothetical protein BAY61_23985 [Prauserella marina]|uniref:PGAP1-like protein n=1 Tax=Prauserella marina TaxID=530584 RepID=A0A222VUF3_9PSEU|nr:alpha/beta hydrolase [Prauserella marina]ASR37556.1 hypothetical protein BAY61_23985 [Prauserella marina]PWV75457.1 PGAP1-like protein [Prauserella marina]SDD34123.1 PGAP1-like protein [Prauserella marina]
MPFSKKGRIVAIVAAAAVVAVGGTAVIASQTGGAEQTTAQAEAGNNAEPAAKMESLNAAGAASTNNRVYFVHGYDGDSKKDCGQTWDRALSYFAKRGWPGDSLKTVGYYKADTNCDVSVSEGTNQTRIKDIAADFANYIYDEHTSKGESIDIVAHSMGGLVTRVALLGSAKGWDGFPQGPLKVGDVATLGTPHQGVICEDDQGDGEDNCPNTTQWLSMDPDSEFMRVLHLPENQLGEQWAAGTDWTLVSSDEDATVSGTSAMDKGHYADHKFRYLPGSKNTVTHSGIRELGSGTYNLRYWHASEGESHDTTNGWAPVKAAYNAVYHDGDW